MFFLLPLNGSNNTYMENSMKTKVRSPFANTFCWKIQNI